MIYLDTHVVVWLYSGLTDKLSSTAVELLNEHDIRISPIVRLELHYLHEIQRLSAEADKIIADLSSRIGLQLCDKPFNRIIGQALTLGWTRDSFDRIIVAHAGLNDNLLLSKDETILANYANGRW